MVRRIGRRPNEAARFLAETPETWLKAYAPGKLKAKRLALLTGMKGTVNG